MHTKTIAELSKALASQTVSSVELTKFFIKRIQQLDQKLNSFITITEEQALQAAQAADKLRQQEAAGPLTGIPFAHKDIFCTQGIKTSCGSRMLDNFISPYDATVVEKLKQSGAVLVGKTNMDEFAMGSSNETSYYGPVKNPWDLNKIPGGSSGGSAAAVAARLIPGATGSDTGGSIRQPAALCGITGVKPTYGCVSRFGMIAFASSLDQAGPMASTAEDCAILLEAMAGFDEKDSTSINRPTKAYTQSLNRPLKGLRLGVVKEFTDDNLNPKVAHILQETLRTLKSQGVSIEEISLPNAHLGVPVYYIIAPAECSSNLSRFDGIRFGYRCSHPKDLEDLYERTRAEGFGNEVKRRVLVGTYVLSAGYYEAYYRKAQQVRRLIRNDFEEAFKKVDAIISPTAPTPAFNLGEKLSDPISMYLSDIYTIGVNLAGLPALSMPGGFIDNLPVGIQLIGNYFAEDTILNIAHQFQLMTDWHTKIPTGF